jgi:hypothetical protein
MRRFQECLRFVCWSARRLGLEVFGIFGGSLGQGGQDVEDGQDLGRGERVGMEWSVVGRE